MSLAAPAVCLAAVRIAAAPPPPRTIAFFNIHTKETITVVYKRNGKYIPEAMTQINWVMRDWRRNEATTMDPALIDLIWEVHAELGSRQPVHIISAFRSRATNNMLRKSVGGQASESRHILGKAADVHFPDVSIRHIRYSALVRERGGVGYYPTSAIPFVHLDTDRVRHWPRMPRHELALLFPDGQTRHASSGGPLSPADTRTARSQQPAVAAEVAAFFDLRRRPKVAPPVLTASASPAGQLGPSMGPPIPAVLPPAPRPVAANPKPAEKPIAMAALDAAPRLLASPQPVERPSRFSAGTTEDQRRKLNELVSLAALERNTALAALPLGEKPFAPVPAKQPPLGETQVEGTWIAAPAYDDEHPEELSYRPFPVAPMLTSSPSPDDPVLCTLSHPDLARTIELIDDGGSVPPLRFRPGQQVAQLLWAQQFQGQSVSYRTLSDGDSANGPAPAGLAERKVTTATR